MPRGEILALIKENNKNPIWAAVLLPIYSVMRTVIVIMETPLPDQGTAVGESEGFCLMWLPGCYLLHSGLLIAL